jgi:short subunit dehydrogenase-like uncharacterized protein
VPTQLTPTPVAIYGAAGYTGRLVAAELQRRGHPVVLLARDRKKLNRDPPAEGRRVAATVEDGSLLRETFADVEVVVNCAGPFAATGAQVLAAALDGGCNYLDTSAEQVWLARAFDDFGAKAVDAGRAAVPQAGFYILIGDLLAGLVGDLVTQADLVTVAYAVHGWRMTPGSADTRPLFLAQRISYRAGQWIHEAPDFSPGEFDFPTPLGRLPVFAYPAGEIVSIPRHLPTKAVQAWMSFGDALPTPSDLSADWADSTFTVLVEATGSERHVRASARGRDIYGISALTIAESVSRLAAPDFPGRGVLAPAAAFNPRDMLDAFQRSGRFEFEYSTDITDVGRAA